MASEEYRRLAEDCKACIDKKDKIIKIYQEKIDDADTMVKNLEHSLIKQNAYINILLEIWSKKNEFVILRSMIGTFLDMDKKITECREMLSYHENEDDMLAEFDPLAL